MTKLIVIAAVFTLCCMAQAQSPPAVYTLNAYGMCGSANGSYCYIYPGPGSVDYQDFVAPNPEPMYYPQVIATYTTGLNIPATFHTGSLHPMPQVPQTATGSGTFQWSDGGPNSGTITVALSCTFGVYPAWPTYAVTCNGTDDAGNNVSFTHALYLTGPHRYGYWSWADAHGTMVITLPSNN